MVQAPEMEHVGLLSLVNSDTAQDGGQGLDLASFTTVSLVSAESYCLELE